MKKLSLLFLMVSSCSFANTPTQGFVRFHDLDKSDYELVMDVSCSNSLAGFCPGPMILWPASPPLPYSGSVTILRAAIIDKSYQARKITRDILNANCLTIQAPQHLFINVDSSGKLANITCPK